MRYYTEFLRRLFVIQNHKFKMQKVAHVWIHKQLFF